MSEYHLSNTDRYGDSVGGRDRRLLPRSELGRRFEDEAKSGVIGNRHPDEKESGPKPVLFLIILSVVFALSLAAIGVVNARFAPMLFDPVAIGRVAASLAAGKNYAAFDLNINSRAFRNAHIAALTETPDVVVLGASHWQEANAELLPEVFFYNAYVHRDYYEDMLSVTEMLVRNNRLPKTMIITIRDNLFTPVEDRTDFLWVPTIPYYRAMARRLGIPLRPVIELVPLPQIREIISLAILGSNIRRWMDAADLPHFTSASKHKTLDTVLADGSIVWSAEHDALFTMDFTRNRALAFAAERRNDPPKIDATGVAEINRLLEFLVGRGVEVYLAHPPFNPVYYDALQGTAYMQGLAEVESLTVRLAQQFGLQIVGGFDPDDVGCKAEMYIDAEHSNAQCLQRVLNGFRELAFRTGPSNPQELD